MYLVMIDGDSLLIFFHQSLPNIEGKPISTIGLVFFLILAFSLAKSHFLKKTENNFKITPYDFSLYLLVLCCASQRKKFSNVGVRLLHGVLLDSSLQEAAKGAIKFGFLQIQKIQFRIKFCNTFFNFLLVCYFYY